MMIATGLVIDIDPGAPTSSYMAVASSSNSRADTKLPCAACGRMVGGRAQFMQIGTLAGTLSAGCKFTLIGYPQRLAP